MRLLICSLTTSWCGRGRGHGAESVYLCAPWCGVQSAVPRSDVLFALQDIEAFITSMDTDGFWERSRKQCTRVYQPITKYTLVGDPYLPRLPKGELRAILRDPSEVKDALCFLRHERATRYKSQGPGTPDMNFAAYYRHSLVSCLEDACKWRRRGSSLGPCQPVPPPVPAAPPPPTA